MTDRTIATADTYWAAHLGCSPGELFHQPCRIIMHRGQLVGYQGAFALFRDGASIVSLPRDRFDELSERIKMQTSTGAVPSIVEALAPVAVKVIGPAYIGYAATLSPSAHPARALGPEDESALKVLRSACDTTEWEHGGSAIEHPCSGVCLDNQLVALAGYAIWGGTIAHISVITHPDFRGHGYGRSAVAHLGARALAAGLLPQYRTLESNHASMRSAESLGFRRYATSVAVRL